MILDCLKQRRQEILAKGSWVCCVLVSADVVLALAVKIASAVLVIMKAKLPGLIRRYPWLDSIVVL